jgi:prolyl-tRNA synthetase
MRGREFVMKDQYSLHATQEDMDRYYDSVIEAYKRVYHRLGIGDSTFVTFASGGSFTKFSHEFQTICDAGEDVLYMNEDKSVAVNEEVLDEATAEIGINKSELKKVVTAEVGNIFKFGTEKSEKMGIFYTDKDGSKKPIYLASYGIGITRVMGVLAEIMADDKGLVWPINVAPYHVYLATIGVVSKEAETLYGALKSAGIEVLYDDRDERPGNKFADAELMGIPYRLVLSPKTLEQQSVELKSRVSDEVQLVGIDAIITQLKSKITS